MSVFIIAEAGVNHNGDLTRALDMIDAAAAAGADAVKFQTFSTDLVIGPTAGKAEYQQRETGEGSQRDMVRPLELSDADHEQLAERCRQRGIEFMSTPFDHGSVDLLIRLGMKRMKVPSGEITNFPFLRYLIAQNLPLIVSTGMATLQEVEEVVAFIAETRAAMGFTTPMQDFVTILHCTSNYPAACADVNLRAMQTIATTTGLPVGYSDHTLGVAVSTAAVGMGAVVIEKHFTMDKTLSGPDHTASLDPVELATLVRQIRDVEAALGSPVKAPTESEIPVRALVRRSVTAARDLAIGETVTEADVLLLRPASGIPAKQMDEVMGRTLKTAVPAGQPLQWTDLA
ncbi:N-acetylneuraminate synthase [Brevundimonas sp. GCM10030266]|uniref:N-acetylneuraminate synthase n=1 Tax=Brevundimonas sp. GCM10030266 TaxID=3273386 RepID=UPI00360FEB00